MPSPMRMFVRVEGSVPFALILSDNLLPEHYTQIAIKYYNDMWHHSRTPPALVLVRRVVFRNHDLLLDFRRKKSKTIDEKALRQAGEIVKEDADAPKIDYEKFTPTVIRESLVVTNPVTSNIIQLCDTELVIKSVTLPRLIMMICDPHVTPYWVEVFWDTYRLYAKPMDVLKLMFQRYDMPGMTKAGDPQRSPLEESYYNHQCHLIKMKVMEMLETWTSKYLFDFADEALYKTLHKWLREMVDRDGIPGKCLENLRGDRSPLSRRIPKVLPGIHSPAHIPSRILGNDFTSKEIAKQITLLTSHVFNNILNCELIGKQWEVDGGKNVPNFVAYRDYINILVNWTTYAVVNEADLATRINNMTKLYAICGDLMDLNNWDALVAVYGGLCDASVVRLTGTTSQLPEQIQPLMTKLDSLLSSRGTSKALKNAMAASPRPHFTSIVTHLRDLVYIEETVPMTTPEGHINFLRAITEHNLVRVLLDGRGSHWDIAPIMEVLGAFAAWRLLDDDVLMEMSNQIQA
eukprot:PhF_6_TR36205/c0_g1_i1/m.52813